MHTAEAIAVFEHGTFVGCYWVYGSGFNAYRAYAPAGTQHLKEVKTADEAQEWATSFLP